MATSQNPRLVRPPILPSESTSFHNFNRSGAFLKLFFRGTLADRNAQNYISNEGSVHESVWNGLNKSSDWKVRLKTMENLEQMSKKRRIQVSVLEGIWAETNDMLLSNNLHIRKAFLSLMCGLTKSQNEEIGLALRLTFFEAIRETGLEELTLKWLCNLTDEGRIEPFECLIGPLLADWLKIVLSLDYHPLASELITLVEQTFTRNSAFLDEEVVTSILHCFCKRISQNCVTLVVPILSCIESVLKYSHIPKSELLPLVVCLCLLITNPAHSSNAWKLMRILLSSVNAYAVLRILQHLLTRFFHTHNGGIPKNSLVMIIRGAVFSVAMALWGSQRIESLRCSPSIIVPSMTEAMVLDPTIGREVLNALRRIVAKYGKSLPQLAWNTIIQSLERAVQYARLVDASEMFTEIAHIITSIENLYAEHKYCGSTESFFMLVESSSDFLPDESIVRFMDYKISCIDPLSGDWITQLRTLVQKYISHSNPAKRREKALSLLRETYYKHRLFYEADVVKNLILQVLQPKTIAEEEDANFQYELTSFLFDLARTVTLKVSASNETFNDIVLLIGSIFNGNAQFSNQNDNLENLEIIACNFGDLLNERWTSLDAHLIRTIHNVLIEHAKMYFNLGVVDFVAADVRSRIFDALLSMLAHPFSQQLVKVIVVSSTSQPTFTANPRIIVGSEENTFKWSSICEITTLALKTDQCWPVIQKILNYLVTILELRCLVSTAGQTLLAELVEAILNLYSRYKAGHFVSVENVEIARHLSPVLGKLINYCQDMRLCKILVECVKCGSIQAIMACDLAVQVLPHKMTLINRQLMENLTQLRPSAQLAIPIIELVGDSADVFEFHEFFQEKHFRSVVDVLAPYSNSRRFNIFIVACVYRVIMRWYSRIPENFRLEMSNYIMQAFTNANQNVTGQYSDRELGKNVRQNKSEVTQCGDKTGPQVPLKISSMSLDASQPSSLAVTVSATPTITPTLCPTEPQRFSTEGRINSAVQLATDTLDSVLNSGKGTEIMARQSSVNSEGIWENQMLTPTSTDQRIFSVGTDVSPEVSPTVEAQQRHQMDFSKIGGNGNLNRSPNKTEYDVSEEALESLRLFMRFWRKRSARGLTSPNQSRKGHSKLFIDEKEEMIEKRIENWIVGSSIFSLRVLTRKTQEIGGIQSRRNAQTFSIERPPSTGSQIPKSRLAAQALAEAPHNQSGAITNEFGSNPDVLHTVDSSDRNSPFSAAGLLRSGSNDERLRRRHASSAQVPQRQSLANLQLKSTRNLMDDTTTREHSRLVEKEPAPSGQLDWIQLSVRNVYNKSTWVMRAFDQIPIDFSQGVDSPCDSDPSTVLMHLCDSPDAVKISPKENEATQRVLRLLDKIPIEEHHAVGVLYIGEGQTSETEILGNQYGSERYVKFIKLLGDVISLDDEPAGLQKGKHGKFTYEYRDAISRIVFLVATLMPNSEDDPKCNAKKSLIGNNFVSIVFNESGVPYKLGTVSGQFDRVALEVVPQDDDTVCVTLHACREIACWLAITRAFLPDKVAAQAIRKMAVRAQLSVNVWRGLDECSRNEALRPYLSQAVDRLRKIRTLKQKGIREN
ncbi:tuberin domain-containing protein [Ditylenchus destructor]|nr:tuberin domain-containing protein [Ditylenchus destructor]